MRVLLLSLLVLFSVSTSAQSCPKGQIFNACDGPQAGPGPCTPGCVAIDVPPVITDPVAPTNELCLPEGCRSVSYTSRNAFIMAESQLPNGYPVVGWAGPCLTGDCPDILNQAFSDLEMNAKRANRAQSFVQ